MLDELRLHVIRYELVCLCVSVIDSLSQRYIVSFFLLFFLAMYLFSAQSIFSPLAAALMCFFPSLASLAALSRTWRGRGLHLYTQDTTMSALWQYEYTVLSSYAWHIAKIICVLSLKTDKTQSSLVWVKVASGSTYLIAIGSTSSQGKHFDNISPHSYKDPLSCYWRFKTSYRGLYRPHLMYKIIF